MPQPNILFLVTDQHRADCLGCAGNADLQTPHLDQLARDGRRFDQTFCTAPVCAPSRYSFLSGLHVHQHLASNNRCTLPAGLPTFPRMLRGAGYRTTAVGKMHLTPTYLDVGFDTMVLSEQDGDGRYDDDYHRYLGERGLEDTLDLQDQRAEYRAKAPAHYWETFGAIESNLPEAHHSTTWIGQRALEELESWNENGGNLLMASFIKPHHPFDPPAPWSAMYDPAKLTLLPGWSNQPLERDLARNGGYFPHEKLTESALRGVMAFYYATISQIDHWIGRMLDLLRERGLYNDTLIIFTSDHGEYLGFHHLLLKGNWMYEPLVRVPLLAKFPGEVAPGTTSSRLTSLVDLAPTIFATAGIEPTQAMSGRDLRGAGHEYVLTEAGGPNYMLRSAKRKLLLGRDRQQSMFLDLESDPNEWNDRYDDAAYQSERRQMEAELARQLMFDAPAPVHLDVDAPQIVR